MWFDIIKGKITEEEFEKRGREILNMPFKKKRNKKDAMLLYRQMLKDGETEYIDFKYALAIMEDFRDGNVLDLKPDYTINQKEETIPDFQEKYR